MAGALCNDVQGDYINLNRIIRTRARKKIDLYPEYHPVHWVNQPLNPSTGVEEPYRDWNLNCINGAITSALRLLHSSRILSHIQFCFRGIWENDRIARSEHSPAPTWSLP